MSCIICGNDVAPRPQNKNFPFCSERCRLLDLSRWLNEDYLISNPLQDSSASESPTPDQDDKDKED